MKALVAACGCRLGTLSDLSEAHLKLEGEGGFRTLFGCGLRHRDGDKVYVLQSYLIFPVLAPPLTAPLATT